MSVSGVSPTPLPPLPSNPSSDEVAANHAAFQQSLVQTYNSTVQAANAQNGSTGTNLPPTQVLGNDPNHAFTASVVDNYLNTAASSSQSQSTNTFGSTLPPLSLDTTFNATLPVQPNPLAQSGIGTNVSSVQ